MLVVLKTRSIGFASPNLGELVTVRFCHGLSVLLGLSRYCLTFKVFLMDVFMSDIGPSRIVGVPKLSLTRSRMVKLDGDRAQIVELRPWFGICSVLG